MNCRHRSAICRADLLRLLHNLPSAPAAAAAALGYEQLEEEEASALDFMRDLRLPPPQPPMPTSQVALPLTMPYLPFIVERENRLRQVPPLSATPPLPDDPPPLTQGDIPVGKYASTDQTNLIPHARLLPALRRQLGATAPGALDTRRLVNSLANAQLPRHLPRQQVRRWPTALAVQLDYRPHLRPYWHDMNQLAHALSRHCGHANLTIHFCLHSPQGLWKDWHAVRQGKHHQRPWPRPAKGTPVLLVSDLGMHAGADSAIAQHWAAHIRSLRQAGLCPLALAPVGATQLIPALSTALPLLRWSPDAQLQPVRHTPSQPSPHPPGLDTLLAMCAPSRRIDPPLLRALRQLNPQAPLNAGLEGAFWAHPDTHGADVATPKPAAQAQHLRRFQQLPPALQLSVNALREKHHQHFGASFRHEETLLWAAHTTADNRTQQAETIKDARRFFARLAHTAEQIAEQIADSAAATNAPLSPVAQAYWRQIACESIGRADSAMAELSPELNTLATALAQQQALPAHAPDWLDPALLETQTDPAPQQRWLVRDARSGSVLLQDTPPQPGQSPLGAPIQLGPAGLRLTQADQHRWLPPTLTRLPLAPLHGTTPFAPITLASRYDRLTLAPVPRPRGIGGWSCGPEGVTIHSPTLGSTVSWGEELLEFQRGEESGEWKVHAPFSSLTLPRSGVLDFGIDDYGQWAAFTITTGYGTGYQRLRWIEPGRFLMGSPEDETERYGDEGPQHEVTLTEGFWLADSACTQALWRAVMGKNPSQFKGDELPVETVSWEDSQTFLRTLQALIPGAKALLPTEAQWEYACRAGTSSPFHTGENISSEQANYNGPRPYAGGEQGEYREKTVPVTAFPPNAWGLYQMHGNVWEWCADGKRAYTADAQTDPRGPEAPEDARALRGGSWFYRAGRLRSAARNAFDPGSSNGNLGFRLALRSIGPGQEVGTAPGLPGRGGEASRDGAPTAVAGLFKRAQRAFRKKFL